MQNIKIAFNWLTRIIMPSVDSNNTQNTDKVIEKSNNDIIYSPRTQSMNESSDIEAILSDNLSIYEDLSTDDEVKTIFTTRLTVKRCSSPIPQSFKEQMGNTVSSTNNEVRDIDTSDEDELLTDDEGKIVVVQSSKRKCIRQLQSRISAINQMQPSVNPVTSSTEDQSADIQPQFPQDEENNKVLEIETGEYNMEEEKMRVKETDEEETDDEETDDDETPDDETPDEEMYDEEMHDEETHEEEKDEGETDEVEPEEIEAEEEMEDVMEEEWYENEIPIRFPDSDTDSDLPTSDNETDDETDGDTDVTDTEDEVFENDLIETN